MNTDTPETDAAYKNHAWDMHDHIPLEFARKLERERDEWKAKYIQQNKDLRCEQMDPNGTIWDHAKKLQDELDEARADAAMWKANHDNQVSLKSMLMDRPDLGDRALRIAELIRERDELAERLDFQEKLNRECIDQITDRTNERDEAREGSWFLNGAEYRKRNDYIEARNILNPHWVVVDSQTNQKP